jgi:hypothetical protein
VFGVSYLGVRRGTGSVMVAKLLAARRIGGEASCPASPGDVERCRNHRMTSSLTPSSSLILAYALERARRTRLGWARGGLLAAASITVSIADGEPQQQRAWRSSLRSRQPQLGRNSIAGWIRHDVNEPLLIAAPTQSPSPLLYRSQPPPTRGRVRQ